MRYNQLGRTGLFVSELCLGTMTFGGEGSGIWEQIGTLEQEAGRRAGRSARSTPASTSSTRPTSIRRANPRSCSASRSRTSASSAPTW